MPTVGLTYSLRNGQWICRGRIPVSGTGGGAYAPESAGAGAVGTTDFTPPSGALYVSPSGSDAAGGTFAAPKRTLSAAITAANSGQAIVLRSGEYHEMLGDITKKVVIQAYPDEVVWFDGSSIVTGWEQAGSVWVKSGWTKQFEHTEGYAAGGVDSQNPLAAWPDQVFIDGTPLWQVSGTPTAGQFSVNYGAQTITIGSNPTGKVVRVSDLERLLVDKAGIEFLGLGFRRFGTPLTYFGVVVATGDANGTRFERCVFEDNATQALSLWARKATVHRCDIRRSGMTGVHVDKCPDMTLTNTMLDGNNTQLWKNTPSTAATKLTRSKAHIAHNIVQGQKRSYGIWLDESCYDTTIVCNAITGIESGNHAIEAEASARTVVAGNYIECQDAYGGVTNRISSDTQVWNNYVLGTTGWQIGNTQDARRAGSHSQEFGAPQTWLAKNMDYCNNILGPVSIGGGLFAIYSLDKESNVSTDLMVRSIDGNVFAANQTPPTSRGRMAGWGGADNVTVTIYSNPATLAAAKGPAWQNTLVAPSDAIPATGGAKLGAHRPIPELIAAAMGIPAGLTVAGPVRPRPVPAA